MPKFSAQSFTRLSTCQRELQVLFYEVVRHFDCTILGGYRNQEAQNRAYAEKASKLRWPNSKHNSEPSMAVDVAPYPVDTKNIKRLYWFSGYVLGVAQKLKDEGKMTHGIRWGGDWDRDRDIDDQTFNDLVHFELI